MKIFGPFKSLVCCKLQFRLALFAFLGISFFAFVAPAYSDKINSRMLQIKPYNLDYTADLDGMKIEATHQLTFANDHFKLITTAKNFLGKITEYSRFKTSKIGNIIPAEYSKRQKTLMGSRSESMQFDWNAKTLKYAVRDVSGTMDLLPNQFDRISLNQQLRIDVASGKKKFSYTVIRKGQLKQYHYQVIGREIVSTSQGSFNSLLIERQGNDAAKKEKIWFALDWDFIILKMETIEKNSTKILVLNQGKLNGNTILPVKKTTEI